VLLNRRQIHQVEKLPASVCWKETYVCCSNPKLYCDFRLEKPDGRRIDDDEFLTDSEFFSFGPKKAICVLSMYLKHSAISSIDLCGISLCVLSSTILRWSPPLRAFGSSSSFDSKTRWSSTVQPCIGGGSFNQAGADFVPLKAAFMPPYIEERESLFSLPVPF
jgi:hypothetical protein